MDYEQKYKEALSRARVVNPGTKDYNIVTTIFPELKKSDDERIRENAIQIIRYSMDRTDVALPLNIYKECINWLEKQNKPQVRTGIEWVNIIDDACYKRYSEEYAHGEYCHEQSFKWGFQEGVDWLEKQGQEKSI